MNAGRGSAVAHAAAALVINAWLLAAVPAGALEPGAARLDYQVDEGLNTNRLVREGPVAAHLVLRSGNDPRILVAFPAGNSGVGVWFMHRAAGVKWTLSGAPQTIRRSDSRGRTLYGLVAQATVEAADLQVRQAVPPATAWFSRSPTVRFAMRASAPALTVESVCESPLSPEKRRSCHSGAVSY